MSKAELSYNVASVAIQQHFLLRSSHSGCRFGKDLQVVRRVWRVVRPNSAEDQLRDLGKPVHCSRSRKSVIRVSEIRVKRVNL